MQGLGFKVFLESGSTIIMQYDKLLWWNKKSFNMIE